MIRNCMNGWLRGIIPLVTLTVLAVSAPWSATLRAQDEDEESKSEPARAEAAPAPMPKRGVSSAEGGAIYRASCGTCHGMQGAGDGPEASGFAFPATDFRQGVYKLRSTAYEKLPTDDDLVRTIREGMPGTEMPPFRKILTGQSIRRVAAYIKSFSPRFVNPEDAIDPKADRVEVPAARPFEPSEESAAAGAQVYQREECGTCHGDNGDGQGADAAGMTDDWDRPIHMLDWSRGVFKSGSRDQDLYRSIVSGMNGTPMEGYRDDTTDAERWQLVDFIRSLESGKGPIDYLFAEQPSGTNYR